MLFPCTRTRAGGRPPGRWQAAWLAACLVLVGLAAPPLASAAETVLQVREASLRLDDGVYLLDAQTRIDLPNGARKAIDAGLTLRLSYEVEILRVRRYAPDADVAALVQTYELVFHALSQRYLVRNLNTGEQRDFASLNSALAALSELRNLPVIDAALLEEGATHECRLRAVIDMGNAPEALRWLLFWTDDWSSSSEWYTWTVR